MNTFSIDVLPHLNRLIFDNLNQVFLFNTSWYTPKLEDGSHFLYLFKSGLPFKKKELLVSHNGNVTRGNWEVVSGNLIITMEGEETMFKTKKLGAALIFAKEGTHEFMMLLNKKACPKGAPSLEGSMNYVAKQIVL